MNEYERLLAYLKVARNNLTTLHRNLYRDASWFGTHEQIGEWYEMLDGMIDDLVETGISLGYAEPSIADAVLAFQANVLPTVQRGVDETLRLCYEIMRSVAGLMQAAEPVVPESVASHLQDLEYGINKEANYKIAQALGLRGGRFEAEDDD